MLVRTYHQTRYRYPSPATDSFNELRLCPDSDATQTVVSFRLVTDPLLPIFSFRTQGGIVHHFNLRRPHTSLTITAESIVETHRTDPFAGLNLLDDDWDFYRREETRQQYAEFLVPTYLAPMHPEACRIANTAAQRSGAGTASFLITLTRLLNGILTYSPGATHVHTTLDEFLQDKQGVCQDFAHLMLAVCRCKGIPARYVSGYVCSPEEPNAMRAEGATHAWVECLMPSGEWRGFDPTNELLANEHYVRLHVGRDYADAAPIKGVYRGPADHEMEVEIRVSTSLTNTAAG